MFGAPRCRRVRQAGGFIMAVSLDKKVSLVKKGKRVGVSLDKGPR